jgi:hypothetical protein
MRRMFTAGGITHAFPKLLYLALAAKECLISCPNDAKKYKLTVNPFRSGETVIFG